MDKSRSKLEIKKAKKCISLSKLAIDPSVSDGVKAEKLTDRKEIRNKNLYALIIGILFFGVVEK